MNIQRDFSKKTLKALATKGVSIIGSQAVPDFDGDRYFSGVAYKLDCNGTGCLRTYSQVIVMASSSWMPDNVATN